MSNSDHPPMIEGRPALDPTVPVLPLKDLVLIVPIKIEDTEIVSSGGIVLPGMGDGEKKYEFGRVIHCGEGAFSGAYGTRIPMDVMVGDEVAYVEKAGWRFRHKGKDYKIIRELDVWLVINPHGAHRSK